MHSNFRILNIEDAVFSMVQVFLILQVDFTDTSLILTEPCFNFTSTQEAMNEILFEEYQFKSIFRTNGILIFFKFFSKYDFSLSKLYIHTRLRTIIMNYDNCK